MRLKEANWALTERGSKGPPHRFKCPRAHIVFVRTHCIMPLVKSWGFYTLDKKKKSVQKTLG